MAAPAISALPTAPDRDSPATFNDDAATFVAALPTLVTEMNAFISWVNSNSTVVGGTLNNTVIGDSTPTTGGFTQLTLTAGNPYIQIEETDASTDEGHWMFRASLGNMLLRVGTDAEVWTDVLKVTNNSGVPSAIDFGTSGSGDGFVMNSSLFRAMTDDAVDLGGASYRFTDIYATNATIQTSGAQFKRNKNPLTTAEKNVALAIKSMMRSFKWQKAIDVKGVDNARKHIGVVAEDVEQAFVDGGLDPWEYGILVKNIHEKTSEDVYGVRYNELICFVLGAL